MERLNKVKKSAPHDILYILHIYFCHLYSLFVLSLPMLFGLDYLSTQFYIYALLSFASIHVIVYCHICYYRLPVSFIFKSVYTNLGVFGCLSDPGSTTFYWDSQSHDIFPWCFHMRIVVILEVEVTVIHDPITDQGFLAIGHPPAILCYYLM